MSDNIKDLLNKAEKLGCIVCNGSKHIKVYSKDKKKLVVVAKSASDKRSFMNIRRDFRRILELVV